MECSRSKFPRKRVNYKWTIEEVRLALMTASMKLKSSEFLIRMVECDTLVFLLCSITDDMQIPFARVHTTGALSKIQPCRCCNVSLEFVEYPSGANIIAVDCSFALVCPGIEPIQNVIKECIFLLNDCGLSATLYLRMERSKFMKALSQGNDTLTIEFSGTFINLDCEARAEIPYLSPSISPSEHSTKVLTDMREKKICSDIQIEVGGQVFHSHRAVLAACSRVFRTMFETNMKEKEERKVIISDMEPQVMADLLEYIYTGTAPQIDEHTQELLIAADKYDISDLVEFCKNKLISNLTHANVSEIVLLADRLRLQTLKQSCIQYCTRFFKDIFKSETWKALKKNSPELAVEITEAALTL